MADIQIQRVNGAEHAFDIGAMQDVCFPGDAKYHAEIGHWWIAFDEDHPVGFGLLMPSVTRDKTGYLALAGVLPSHRGRGLQLRLVKARLQFAKKLGWVAVVTDTTDNPPSANNLIRAGMKTYRPHRPWGRKQTIYWRIRF